MIGISMNLLACAGSAVEGVIFCWMTIVTLMMKGLMLIGSFAERPLIHKKNGGTFYLKDILTDVAKVNLIGSYQASP